MRYRFEIAGLHAKNKDGTERKKIVRKYLAPENNKYAKPVLVREKDNRHDKNAIAVYIMVHGLWDDKCLQIGYLPREDAKEVSHFWDSGGKISNVEIARVWLPDNHKSPPYVHVCFEATWSQEDIDRHLEEKRRIEREKRRARKPATQAEENHAPREEEQRRADSVRVKALNEFYGYTPYVWLIIIILLVICFATS
ncbi:hypothetical protein FIH25_17405 [Salmonella enterica subsp. enterica]|nr:hypothetical protein [Salmonella enterica subsp. enterica serovar Louisiana]